MDRFQALMLRAANLLSYGATREEVRAALGLDGVPEDLIFLAYVAARILTGDSHV